MKKHNNRILWIGVAYLLVMWPFLALGAALYLLADMLRALSDWYEAGIDWVTERLKPKV